MSDHYACLCTRCSHLLSAATVCEGGQVAVAGVGTGGGTLLRSAWV